MRRARTLLALAVALAGISSSAGTTSARRPNTLQTPQVSPTAGTTASLFSFRVTYTGGFAAISMAVGVAGRTVPMALTSGTLTDGTWTTTTGLRSGSWSTVFSAVASQGKHPRIRGPSVIVTALVEPPALSSLVSAAPSAAADPEAAPVATDPSAAEATGTPLGDPPGLVSGQLTEPAEAQLASEIRSDATVASVAPTAGSGGAGEASSAAASVQPAWPEPEPRSADALAGTPIDGMGVLVAAIGIAVALVGWLLVRLGRRRRHAADATPGDGRSALGTGTATDAQVAAALHRRILRRAKVRLDEDPIVAAVGGMPAPDPPGTPTRPGGRRIRRPPPN